MKKALSFLNKNFEKYLLVILLCFIAVIMLVQVIARYVFGQALGWPEEVCRYLYIWSCFLGISYCLQNGTELRIDMLEKALPEKARQYWQLALKVICIVYYAYMFRASINVVTKVQSAGQLSPAALIPMYLVYIILPVSFGLTVIRGIQSAVRLLKPAQEQEEASL